MWVALSCDCTDSHFFQILGGFVLSSLLNELLQNAIQFEGHSTSATAPTGTSFRTTTTTNNRNTEVGHYLASLGKKREAHAHAYLIIRRNDVQYAAASMRLWPTFMRFIGC